jgi:hypothetical protein
LSNISLSLIHLHQKSFSIIYLFFTPTCLPTSYHEKCWCQVRVYLRARGRFFRSCQKFWSHLLNWWSGLNVLTKIRDVNLICQTVGDAFNSYLQMSDRVRGRRPWLHADTHASTVQDSFDIFDCTIMIHFPYVVAFIFKWARTVLVFTISGI